MLVSVLFHHGSISFGAGKFEKSVSLLVFLYLANATFVLLAMSYSWEASWEVYAETLKFTLLFYLVLTTVKSESEFLCLINFIVIGMLYWGVYAKFGTIHIVRHRLEYFGGPGCYASNELASIVVTLLPLIAAVALVARAERGRNGEQVLDHRTR